jgi:hypothetical protein
MTTDPTTPAEWREAVCAADFYLAFDAARQYGLITGGDAVNVERCMELLQRAVAFDVLPPSPTLRRALISQYVASARKRLGLTQRVLAARTHYSPTWLSFVETGRRAITETAWRRLHATIRAIEEEYDG